MNDNQTIGFIKEALVAGYSRQQILDALTKQAEESKSESVVTTIVKEAGLPVNNFSVGFVEGVIKEGMEQGLSYQAAADLSKLCLNKIAKSAQVEANRIDKQKLAAYCDDFVKAAVDAGYSEDQGYELLFWQLGQKKANADLDMFKSAPGGMQSGGMPGPQPGGMPGGMMQGALGQPTPGPSMPAPVDAGAEQLDPALLQQLIAMISGGGAPQAGMA